MAVNVGGCQFSFYVLHVRYHLQIATFMVQCILGKLILYVKRYVS